VSHTQRLTVVLLNLGLAALTLTVGALVLRADTGDDDDGNDEGDLSVAAVLLDTIADAAAAAGVAATGEIILATGGWYWLDPAVALVIAVVSATTPSRCSARFSADSGYAR
jgi:cobalt-zinc-cadmium efflux system protein